MGELLPTFAARGVRDGLLEYLDTTFSLADQDARAALTDLLQHPEEGIFKGPYLRLRLPFRPASDGWRAALDWHPTDDDPGAFPPYGHQARAFARLSAVAREGDEGTSGPQPTLVTTGTGSGKTEAFLYPILDHVLRAKRQGVGGMKALLLYPMNALANDQAQRLAGLLTTHPSLAGVTAGLYTGEAGATRTKVSAEGLITDREVMRSSAPDILLTNYKMLDQLLLRHADRKLWSTSATSLQYLVLDEFHTYDGAQGTDVAMLLRRLGLALRAHGRDGDGALAGVTPVATSATLGDSGDPTAMLSFAQTVFGVPFADDAVVTESRLTIDEWTAATQTAVEAQPVDGPDLVDGLVDAAAACGLDPEPLALAVAVAPALYDGDPGEASLADRLRAHPLTRRLLLACSDAAPLSTVARMVLPDAPVDRAQRALEVYVAVLSHLRAVVGRGMPSVELHLWVRELTRVDREAAPVPAFAWGDDGGVPLDASVDGDGTALTQPVFPALYCRHCGRSGWGVTLSPDGGADLDSRDDAIRRDHAQGKGRFRPLIHATRQHEVTGGPLGDDGRSGLRWFLPGERRLLASAPDEQDAPTAILPVLTHVGLDAADASRHDECPACGQRDGIRFLGSAVATQLSVALSSLFGNTSIDPREKKTLVFTDSVQDAAHRAGFVQARSRSLTVRSVLREAIGDAPCTLDELPDRVLQLAGDDPTKRARILPPDLVERPEFAPFWERATFKAVPVGVRNRVRRRVAFDAALEFGLQSRIGRTLELTSTTAAQVQAPAAVMAAAAREALEEGQAQLTLDGPPDDATLTAWVRGVLERMRQRGAIEHDWLRPYVKDDGSRHRVWRGRRRNDGMPAFPIGRTAPAFPRVGPESKQREKLLDQVTGHQGWYAQWATRVLHVTAREGAVLSRLLMVALTKADLVEATHNDAGADVFALRPGSILLEPVGDDELRTGKRRLVCQACRSEVPGTADVIDQLDGAPCLVTRCSGFLERDEGESDNFYRRFYTAHEVQRIIAREHTSLLDDTQRLAYENGFKGKVDQPQAPNVLVATPTLEMGIDVGDLSTVMLASLPRTVAGYVQRVGRAGRLSGSALNLAFVTGRGEHLPLLGDPASLINGTVRPPATYLDAAEILSRQFLAAVADEEARDPGGSHPSTADQAIGETGPNGYLSALIARAEGDPDRVDRFLASFSSLRDGTADALRAWARPVDGPATSGLARRIHAAAHRWTQQIEELGHRITAIGEALPDLQRVASSPARTDEDEHAVKTAEASRRLAQKQRAELRGEYWISVLERIGLFPNYTLLGDDVTLDVGLSWQHPDSGAFETDTHAYRRGAALALREFAPGSTFYAGGHEIKINAVELGSGGDGVRAWALCPECGYGADVSGQDGPIACPRCQSPGIADVSQRFDVVELQRVSSTMRRDEATIDDARDERRRERFEVIVSADIDPANVTGEWFVQDYGFGARHVRDVQLRWLNVGRANGQGAPRWIAGREIPADLFRVCAECGQLDGRASKNSAREHRPWCSRRKADDEHTVSVALSRSLTTEGLLLRLPPLVALGNTFAVPSIVAAIKLGLREHIGGAPDHLAIELVVDPQNPDTGADSVLLHDIVPGGTGYLAELADPAVLRAILRKAHAVVRDCDCGDQGRVACHRCLLPFADYGRGQVVSRSEAQRQLEDLLTADGTVDLDADAWPTTSVAIDAVDPESKMEQRFRYVLRQRLEAIGATITVTPQTAGERWQINAGAGRHWSLIPQVMIAGSKPDFVLRSDNPNVPEIAIFCDGWRYHASPEHNRLYDDATKRELLRDSGRVVLSLVWPDLDADDGASLAPWLDGAVAAQLLAAGQFGLKPGHLDLVRRGPLDLLVSWIQKPDPDGLRALGRAVPFLLAAKATRGGLDDGADLSAAAAALLDGTALPNHGSSAAWAWRDGPVALTARLPANQDPNAVAVSVVLDDRDDAVADTDGMKAAWRTWLHLGNLLALRSSPAAITVRSLAVASGAGAKTVAATNVAPVPPSSATAPALGPEWKRVIADAINDERAVLEALAADGFPAPEDGPEVDGLPLGPSWPDLQVTLDLDFDDAERAVLRAAGWTVVALDPDAVRAALRGEA